MRSEEIINCLGSCGVGIALGLAAVGIWRPSGKPEKQESESVAEAGIPAGIPDEALKVPDYYDPKLQAELLLMALDGDSEATLMRRLVNGYHLDYDNACEAVGKTKRMLKSIRNPDRIYVGKPEADQPFIGFVVPTIDPVVNPMGVTPSPLIVPRYSPIRSIRRPYGHSLKLRRILGN